MKSVSFRKWSELSERAGSKPTARAVLSVLAISFGSLPTRAPAQPAEPPPAPREQPAQPSAALAETTRTSAAWIPVPAGDYAPLLRAPDEPERVGVPAFRMQRHPVTNADFLAFVRAHPGWRRG
ncbi:MAG: hypothetical protein MUE42_13525, partial [Opitutaceae bacterium]|nr:hypothetical protein [Opitutaceae bacterium]